MNEGYSLADIGAVTNGGNGGFGGEGAWVLIILFALIWGRNGFGGNNGGGSNGVSEAGLCNAMNFNNLENAVGRINDQICNQTMTLSNGISNLGYETLSNFNNIMRQIADCCCTTQRAIDGVNYNIAMLGSNVMQNQDKNTQKILDAMCRNKQEEMQQQINQLQLQAALQNVVRYPQGFVYNAGLPPFCCPTQVTTPTTPAA